MTLIHLRRTMRATLVFALFTGATSLAQKPVASIDQATVPTSVADLPDAPSFAAALQQPSPPTQTQSTQTQSSSSQQPGAQSTPPQNETEAQRKAREQKEEAEREVKAEEKQRFGGVMPQFNVVMSGRAVPLTPRQKFDLSFHTIIDPYTIGLAFLVGGGEGELADSHPGYGHGTAGFFYRVGASYADNIDGNLIGNALLPVILHQDPRYFRKGQGSIKSRIVYSALTTFICRSDAGKKQFNTSNVLGNFIAGAISNAYYPAEERGVGLTIQNGVTVTLEGMLGAQILEFSPDISDYVHKRREHHRMVLQQKQQGTTPSTP